MNNIFTLLKPCRGKMLLALLLALFNVSGTLVLPVLFGRAIDCIKGVGTVDFAGLYRIFLLTVLIALCDALCQYIQTRICQRIAYRTVAEVRRKGFSKLHTLPVSYLDAHPPGELMSLLTSDAEQLCDGILMGFSQFFPGIGLDSIFVIFSPLYIM